jgi:nucleoside phosphorylase
MPIPALSREDYTVGIICALDFESAAVQATFDEEYDTVQKAKGDDNAYACGRIGAHNVVVAFYPARVMGKAFPAVALNMMRSFPRIKARLSVGICGGVGSEYTDIRLGDVIVSQPDGMHGGVVQWDNGKMEGDRVFRRIGTLDEPSRLLLYAIQSLKARHILKDSDVGVNLAAIFARYPRLIAKFQHPGEEHDEPFEASYGHAGRDTCVKCDRSRLVRDRPDRIHGGPQIHYGKVASNHEVLKDGLTRDRIAREEGVLCFETEAPGLMNSFPCVVIRGVCDYADSHSNKQWQGYAAMVAAAYAQELLMWMPSADVATIEPTNEATGW